MFAGASWSEGPGLATALGAGVVGMAGSFVRMGVWGDAEQAEVVSLFVGSIEKLGCRKSASLGCWHQPSGGCSELGAPLFHLLAGNAHCFLSCWLNSALSRSSPVSFYLWFCPF